MSNTINYDGRNIDLDSMELADLFALYKSISASLADARYTQGSCLDAQEAGIWQSISFNTDNMLNAVSKVIDTKLVK